MKKTFLLLFLFQYFFFAQAQDINALVQKIKDKMNLVNDYEATGKMKTNVIFLKVPVATIKLFFKRPDQLKIVNETGISFVPKGAVNINLNNVLSSGNYKLLDAGKDNVAGKVVQVIKLLPEDDNSDVVLSTLYIDPVKLVILKTRTTTRDNGTYELEMSYGKYIAYGLPDKITFTFNTKDYKMPRGVTFDFEDGAEKKKTNDNVKNKNGKVEFYMNTYTINKGIADSVFK